MTKSDLPNTALELFFELIRVHQRNLREKKAIDLPLLLFWKSHFECAGDVAF